MVTPLDPTGPLQRVVYSYGGHTSLGELASLVQLFESIVVGIKIFNL